MSAARTFSPEQAQAYYDKFAEKQDKQGWYETPAIDELKAYGQFETARTVFELGCGTGKLARELIGQVLPVGAHYLGVDLSPVMVEIAQARLSPYGARAQVILTDGSLKLPSDSASCDRFIACYVFDLLAEPDIDLIIAEAHRVLSPGGLLCAASLTNGSSLLQRLVSDIWSGLHKLNPNIVGGCRPIVLSKHLSPKLWKMAHHTIVTPFGLSSETIVAERI